MGFICQHTVSATAAAGSGRVNQICTCWSRVISGAGTGVSLACTVSQICLPAALVQPYIQCINGKQSGNTESIFMVSYATRGGTQECIPSSMMLQPTSNSCCLHRTQSSSPCCIKCIALGAGRRPAKWHAMQLRPHDKPAALGRMHAPGTHIAHPMAAHPMFAPLRQSDQPNQLFLLNMHQTLSCMSSTWPAGTPMGVQPDKNASRAHKQQ